MMGEIGQGCNGIADGDVRWSGGASRGRGEESDEYGIAEKRRRMGKWFWWQRERITS